MVACSGGSWTRSYWPSFGPLLGVDALDVHAFHLRQEDGRHEIDVILESADGRIVGTEIKATASAGSNDARHLAWLRDQLGPRFAAGVVLTSGRAVYPLGERLTAVPIAALWAPES
jgi:uncharacterized protein